MYCYKYPRPMATVDILIFNIQFSPAKVLLIRRKNDPYKNYWAIPGGFLDLDEELIEAARRELAEETGITGMDLIQTTHHTKPGRDPRGRTLTFVFASILSRELKTNAGDDASEAQWFGLDELPELAFDHLEIIEQNRIEIAKKILFEGYQKYFFLNLEKKLDIEKIENALLVDVSLKRNAEFFNEVQNCKIMLQRMK